MTTASFVWIDDHGTGRNVFALFRRRFRLAKAPKKAVLNLFVDTRYRLRVNGAVASYGPARFVPLFPEHDVVDLAPLLRKGWNVVTVEANHKGASAFDSLPSIGGFRAWGRIGALDFATPGLWLARRAEAWDAGAPVFSFAQGPQEICDLRRLPPAWFEAGADGPGWSTPVPLAAQKHWGPLTPRSIPALTLRERLPAAVPLVAPVRDDEQRIGFREDGEPSRPGAKRLVLYATGVHSPNEQEVVIGLFWGRNWLNGEELKPATHAYRGNRQEATVRLRAGWNLLYGELDMLSEAWLAMIGLPHGHGLTASAEPRLDAPAAMLRVASLPEAEVLAARGECGPADFEQLRRMRLPWRPVPRDAELNAPAREVAWDVPDEASPHDAGLIADVVLPCADGRAATAVFDFGGEYLGHALIEVEAPAGTRIDVAYSERRRPDGALGIFATNWIINEVERFVARGGRETWEGFHARGGRYLQVTARGASGPVTLRRVAIRETLYPLRVEGAFACADPVLSWVWSAGVDTLRACTEDAWLDCPWRERGLYIGDALVEYHATRAATADDAMVRRCLRLWAQAQREDGQFQDVVPSWHETALEDYSLIWLLLLHDHWAASGDAALVRELWGAVAPLFASPSWRFAESGLIDCSAMHVFADWSERLEAKRGESGVLFGFWCRALECAAILAGAIGERAQARDFARRAKAARATFDRALWDEGAGRYAAARVGGKLLDGPAAQVNALAACYGLAPRARIARALDALEADLDANEVGGGKRKGLIGPYFLIYALDALYRHGRAGAAERAVRRSYAAMRAAGAWTLWETFSSSGSLCHAWSAAPMRFFAERTLGVRQVRPARPDEVVVAPESDGLDWAEGVVPHRLGPIAVAWERHGEVLRLRVRAPRGLRWRAVPGGALARLRLELDRG